MKCIRLVRIGALTLSLCCLHAMVNGQSNDQGLIRGTVSDSRGAVIPGANVTLTDVGTNVSEKTTSNDHGIYVFTGLRAANYRMLIESAGFGPVEKAGIALDANQQTTLNVTLAPAAANASVTVESTPVLLDADNATLGTDVGTKYLTQVPLENRDPFGLAFLAAGVTETAGSGIQDGYPAGTNFVSNGQRNATAEIRLDGTLTTAPEQGEGGTSNIYYQATVEALQEVKVQNNSFSAEYGNNGGTVLDEVMKSGTNSLHGSAYEFNQNSIFDARDYFNSGPKPGHSQNQFGASIGGPIKKNKTSKLIFSPFYSFFCFCVFPGFVALARGVLCSSLVCLPFSSLLGCSSAESVFCLSPASPVALVFAPPPFSLLSVPLLSLLLSLFPSFFPPPPYRDRRVRYPGRYPAGTNFVSNGQRNATAEIRLDGTLTTAPEQGEGGTSNIYYQATVEALQEVKVQNNSFSAEYGNNGGTVLDEVMKSGTNSLHGSAYEFNQNSIFDARDYFNSGPKPGHSQNQFGASIGGPIKKNKTFLFADFESVIASNPVNIVATVPTAAQINGDFSQAMTYDQNGNRCSEPDFRSISDRSSRL